MMTLVMVRAIGWPALQAAPAWAGSPPHWSQRSTQVLAASSPQAATVMRRGKRRLMRRTLPAPRGDDDDAAAVEVGDGRLAQPGAGEEGLELPGVVEPAAV